MREIKDRGIAGFVLACLPEGRRVCSGIRTASVNHLKPL